MDRCDAIDGRHHPFVLKDKDGVVKNKTAFPVTRRVTLTAEKSGYVRPIFI